MAREFGSFVVPPADIAPGTYRALTGAEGVAMGLVAGARLAGLPLLFTGYPVACVTPIQFGFHQSLRACLPASSSYQDFSYCNSQFCLLVLRREHSLLGISHFNI